LRSRLDHRKRQTLQDITTSQELDDGQPPVEQLTNPSISLHQQAKENILQDLFGQQPEKQQTQANGNSFFNAKPVSQTSLTRESVSATLHALAEVFWQLLLIFKSLKFIRTQPFWTWYAVLLPEPVIKGKLWIY